jgi:hypothetical protein
MDHDHAKKIMAQIVGLDPGIGEAMHLIDDIADESEKNLFHDAIGKLLFHQNELIRMIVRRHRDLEEDFSRFDDEDDKISSS